MRENEKVCGNQPAKFFYVFIGMWILNYYLENISDNTGLSVYPENFTHINSV